MKHLRPFLPTLSIPLLLAGCTTLDRGGSSVEDVADGLSAEEFRAYGLTSPTALDTTIGRLEFTEGGFAGGYPTIETAELLHDTLDFQRATLAYLWALPLVSYAGWLEAHEEVFGAQDGQVVFCKSIEAKQGILTANVTTPYSIAFADLGRTGPLVFEVPPGPFAGIVNDMWQRAVLDVGVSGPDRGEGVKVLLLAPGEALPTDVEVEEYTIVESPTRIAVFGGRALQPDRAEGDAFLRSIRTYPYTERENPPEQSFIDVGDDVPWGQWQPHGMAYWDLLHRVLEREVVEERDRLMLSLLDSLGLRKGEPFAPNERQRRILKEAAVVGEAMAKANTFDKRFTNLQGYSGTNWDQLLVVSPDDRDEHFDQLFRRASFTYEAVTRGEAYYIEQPGIGQQYRCAYKDGDGEWLLGSRHYTLTMPPNPPAETFWSLVLYDVNTRTPLKNSDWNPAVSSRTGVVPEADGTVVVHLAPSLPEGVDPANWIETNAGESWFAYLRFYGPTQAYFDESYPLQDIRRVR